MYIYINIYIWPKPLKNTCSGVFFSDALVKLNTFQTEVLYRCFSWLLTTYVEQLQLKSIYFR